MHHGRGADIDDVEILHGEEIFEPSGAPRHVELVGEGVEPRLVEVAGCQHHELVRIGHEALDDVRPADAEPDDGDRLDVAGHAAAPLLRSASSCA